MRCFVAIGLAVLLFACAPVGPNPGATDAGTHRMPIFFEEWSTALDHDGLSAVGAAAEIVRQHPGVPVMVIGYDDPEGSMQENLSLSRDRAQVVMDALVLAGIPASQITREAKGAATYTSAAWESRRGEIVIDDR